MQRSPSDFKTIAIAVALILAGCAEFGWNPLDPRYGELQPQDYPPLPAMSYEVRTLRDASVISDQTYDKEADTLLQRRDWRTAPPEPVHASMIVLRHASGGSLTPPGTPQEAAGYWPELATKRLRFYTLFQSQNAVGPVHWQRFTKGPNICVMFSQAWNVGGSAGSETARRIVAGFYCAPPARELTEGQAETIVRSVRIRDFG